MIVSLYTSRIILRTLGIEDYGIYSIVGSTVSLFGFLNASMSGTTARFLSYEIGNNYSNKLNLTFCSAVNIHFIIATIVFFLLETVGLFLLNYKLVIPFERITAANLVYQFVIISTIINIIQVPYNASIISHEKMNIYAYIEILNVVLKCIIVIILMFLPYDKLILYGFLTLFVSIFIAFFYWLYSTKHFSECHYTFLWDKDIIKPMISFSGWDMYGHISSIARSSGIAIILNIFGGPIINAANGIAGQVQGAISSFGTNVVMAVKPQLVKTYAQGNISYMMTLIYSSIKYVYILILCLTIPVLFETNFILNIWLNNFPNYTVSFCRWTLIYNFFSTMSCTIVNSIHATGHAKRVSIINGTIYILVIPISYVLLRIGLKPTVPFIANTILIFVGLISNMYTLSLYIKNFNFKDIAVIVVRPCLLITIISVIIPLFIYHYNGEGWIRFIMITVSSTISIFISCFCIDSTIRNLIKSKLTKYFYKIWEKS